MDAFVGAGDGNTRFFRNTGTATAPAFSFGASNFGLTDVGDYAAPTLADIDGDGDLDAFVGAGDGNTRFFRTNRAPVLNGAVTATVTEEAAPFNVNLLTNAVDLDKDTLTVANVTFTGNNAGITVSGNTLNINPNAYTSLNAAQNSVITYTYNVIDSNGGVTSQTATITITGVNDAASISGIATASVTEDDSNPNLTATGTLTVTDVDAGQNQFSTTVTGASGNLGSLSITNTGEYAYTVTNSAVQYLNTGDTKTETFTVSSLDGTATQESVVTINGVSENNSPPVANPDSASVVEGQSVIIPVLANDTDPDTGDILSINSFTNPINGTITQNADGTLTYTANLNFSGTDSFTYTIKDSSNAVSSPATVNLTVNPLNLEGDANNNTLIGTASPNIINGNDGNDLIEGRAGNDTLDGGFGFNDRIFGHGDNDTITDPDGINAANGGSGNDTITVTFAAAWGGSNPRSDGKISGGYGDDVITVTMNKSNFFLNMKGDESVSNTPQDGNDTVTLAGSYANAVVDLGGGNDTFNGGVGVDNISAGNGTDNLLGMGGNDQLSGQGGNDTLRGGLGNDKLTGGADSDLFVLAVGFGSDTITDFRDGTDLLGLAGGLSFAQLSVAASGSNTQIRLTSSNALLATLTGVSSTLITDADFITV